MGLEPIPPPPGGGGRGGGRGGSFLPGERGAARGRGGRGTPVQHPSQPCLRCGSDSHNRSKCPEAKTTRG